MSSNLKRRQGVILAACIGLVAVSATLAVLLVAAARSGAPAYESVEQMAAALKGTPAECRSLEQAQIEELGLADQRYRCAMASGSLVLGKYQLPEHRQEELPQLGRRVVYGPNWAVVVEGDDSSVVAVVAEALRGAVTE
jgi:hypothetical protein